MRTHIHTYHVSCTVLQVWKERHTNWSIPGKAAPVAEATLTGLPNPSRETKFSGANADREIFILSVQLTTSRIGNLTRLILILAICVTIHTYIHNVQTYIHTI